MSEGSTRERLRAQIRERDEVIDTLRAQRDELKRLYRRRGAYIRWMRWIARKDRAGRSDR